MKAQKPATAAVTGVQPKSSGLRLVEKYRPKMSRLSDVQRQKLMARGLQIVYGDTAAAKPAHRS